MPARMRISFGMTAVAIDVSSEAGVEVRSETSGNPAGKGLAVLPADVDSDGWTDLVVANDTVRNFLFINQQDGTRKPA